MTQKFLYIVQHYVPFPSSEYGGLWNLIAANDNECFDLIAEKDSGNFYEKYYTDLRENIIKAPKFALLKETESKVVEAFLT
jgi:hypothetical protein